MKNKSAIQQAKFLYVIILLMTFTNLSFSQEIFSLTGESIASSNFETMKANDGDNKSVRSNSKPKKNKELKKALNLIYNINPTIYISKSGVSVPSDRIPVIVSTDPDDMAPIFNANPIFNSVELLTLKISHLNDLDPKLNLRDLKTFPKLKYIYVESVVPITLDDILNFIQNRRRNITIIFKNASQS